MVFKLETPEHQRIAIQSVVEVFRGMEKNTYDNATDEDIRWKRIHTTMLRMRTFALTTARCHWKH